MTDLPKSEFDKIPFSAWKDLMDMRRWYKRTYAFGAPGTGTQAFTRATDFVNIGNDTATHLIAGSVVELENELLCDDEDDPMVFPPWLNGVLPTLPGSRFAVLTAICEAKDGTELHFALAQTSGVCLARVNIANDAHDRAGVTVGQHYLTSSLTGPVQILHKPAGTGVKLCFVNLSNRAAVKVYGFTGSGGIAAATLATSEITPGSASVDVWTLQGSPLKYKPLKNSSAVQVTETVYNPWPSAIEGSRLISFSEDRDGRITVDAEACEAF